MNWIKKARKTPYVLIVNLLVIGLVVNIVGPLVIDLLQNTEYGSDISRYGQPIFPLAGYIIMAFGVLLFLYRVISSAYFREIKIEFEPLKKELDAALIRVEKEPEKAKPVWDLARVKLELYFDRNLSQINYIFWLSLGVMIVGFAFILYGISQAFTPIQEAGTAQAVAEGVQSRTASSNVTPAIIGGIAGIITEFIGATFLFVYRSTIQQAVGYTRTLERINSVGMAMQILDSISKESKKLQDKTKAEIVKILLSQPEGSYTQSNGRPTD